VAKRDTNPGQFPGPAAHTGLRPRSRPFLKLARSIVPGAADTLAAILVRGDAERQLIAKAKQRQIDSREELLDDMLARYESDRCGVGGIRGTAWAAFNAVTEHAVYAQPRRQVGSAEERLSRRWESALTGDGDRLKQTAFEMLTERAGGRPAAGALPRIAA
jgi:hypothetical protein